MKPQLRLLFVRIASLFGAALFFSFPSYAQALPQPVFPQPLHHWVFWTANLGFGGQATDVVGGLKSTLHGATVSNGRLIVGPNAYMQTAALPETITQKTLVSWVSLDSLSQGGGSALTIENSDPSSNYFDAIDFGERTADQWMAGSNNFNRSPANNNGAAESQVNTEVMIAIVYGSDNSITIYRNGLPYASSYTQGGLQTYAAGSSDVVIGLRHSTCGSSCYLSGSIRDAQLWGVALTADQIAELYAANAGTAVVPSQPSGMAFGDFNGDGKLDIATANFNSPSVSVLLGNGAGGFTPTPASPISMGSAAVASVAIVTADFNRDGKLDLAVTAENNSVHVLLGDGTGGVTDSTLAVVAAPFRLLASDFNNDGNQDLLVGTVDGQLKLYLGNGAGAFTPTAWSRPSSAGYLAKGDFNKDGNLDFLFVSNVSNLVGMELGDGKGSFTDGVSLTAVDPLQVAVGDFNNDGNLDFAIDSRFTSDKPISVFLGNGAGGTFTPAAGSPFGIVNSFSSGLTAGDLNGDGNLDLAAISGGTNSLMVLLGDGTGAFSPAGSVPAYNVFSGAIGLADFNGDGVLDLALAENEMNIVLGHTRSSISLTSSANPSIVGQSVNFTATVTPSSAKGTVQFAIDGANFGSPLAVTAGTASSPSISTLSKATHMVTATFVPSNFSAGSSGSLSGGQVVIGLGQTITFNALPNQILAAAPFTISATASSGLAVSFTSATTTVCTVSNTTVTLVAPGLCTIVATQSGNGTYASAASVTQSFWVATQNEPITFNTLPNRALVSLPFSLFATTPSGAPVSFVSSTNSVCTVSGSSVTVLSTGTCTIMASGVGGNSVSQSFTVVTPQVLMVANGDVSGPNGLIAAINQLNASGGGFIQLAANGNYSLDMMTAPDNWWYGPNAFPAIQSSIYIEGNGATISRAAGSPNFRFFYISGGFSTLPGGALTLHHLTLQNGIAQGGRGGRGVAPGGGGGGMGGAVFNQGQLSLVDVQLMQNAAQGGAGGTFDSGTGFAGGGGMVGNGGFASSSSVTSGGGGFRDAGTLNSGGGFTGTEGGTSVGGTSLYGGNGANGGNGSGGGGGGWSPGQNAGATIAGVGGIPGLGGGGGGPASGLIALHNNGGGGAFGGGGGPSGGGGGIGGGGGGGLGYAGHGGFGGGGGGGGDPNGGGGGFGGGDGGFFSAAFKAMGHGANGGDGMGGAVFNHSISASAALVRTTGTANVAHAGAAGNVVLPGTPGSSGHGFGGLIYNLNGNLTIEDYSSTSSSNTADSDGNSLYVLSSAQGITAAGPTPSATLRQSGNSIATTQIGGNVPSTAVSLPELTVQPAILTFGPTVLNTDSASLPVTVTNNGATAVTFKSFPTTGDFHLQNTCASIAVGASCTLNIVFHPTALTSSGVISLVDNAPDGMQAILLSGTAILGQIITFGPLPNPTFGTAPFTITATASSGLAVSFASTTTTVCTVSGTTVTIVAAGTCTIQATQAGNATYPPAPVVNQTFTVNKATVTASVAIQPLYFSGGAGGSFAASNPPPANCNGITGACQAYTDPSNFSITVSPASVAGVNALIAVQCATSPAVTAPCLNIRAGGATRGPATLTLDAVNNVYTGSIKLAFFVLGVNPVSAVLQAGVLNPNFQLAAPTTPLTVVREDSRVIYTGLTDFTTSGTATTMSIATSYTIKDPSVVANTVPIFDTSGPGEVVVGSFVLTLTGTSPSGPFTGICNPAAPHQTSSGIGTFACTFTNVPVNGSYQLKIAAAPNSVYDATNGDLNVTINNGNDGGGSINGSGFQTAEYLLASNLALGKYTVAGLLVPAPKTKVEFNLDGKYNNKGIDAKVKITLQSKCVTGIKGYTPKPDKDGLCKYEISADDVESLTLEPPDNFWVSSATIQDADGKGTTIAANVQLQMMMNVPDKKSKDDPTISIQITDAVNGLWFSNNWDGEKTQFSTIAPAIQGGTIELK